MIIGSQSHTLSKPGRHSFDLFVNATGYEQRASSLVKNHCVSSKKFVSFLFDKDRTLAFDENVRVMESVAASFITEPLPYCRQKIGTEIKELSSGLGRSVRIGIDVSSMNRTMAATLLTAVISYRELIEAVELFYVPGQFVEPKLQFLPIEQIGAVTPELSGFNSEPGLPIALVLGLGYEYGTAVGIIHQLEPQFTLCLRAMGHNKHFEEAVRRANLEFDFSTYNVEVSEYDLLNAVSAYSHIENIVYSLLGNFRVVLVPMGPKILSSILVLIALRYFGKIAVWRVARNVIPADIPADGNYLIASVDLKLAASEESVIELRKMIEGDVSWLAGT